jgi:hypothetical protein
VKPEKLIELRQHRREVEEHQKAAEALRVENPGPPAGSEVVSYLERYDQMAKAVTNFLNPDDKESVFKDETGRIISGTTPVLPILITHEQETLELGLRFWIEYAHWSQDSITSVWTDPSGDQTDKRWRFHFEETSQKSDLEGEPNELMQTRLNNLEWSFLAYRDAALSQSPEDADARGFSREFVEGLKAKNLADANQAS